MFKVQRIFLLIVLIPAIAPIQQEFPLVFSPTIGDQLVYSMNISIQAEGKDFTGTDLSLAVIASGVISLDVKRKVGDRVFIGLTTPGIQLEVQTLEGKQLHSLKTKANQALQAKFDPNGRVSEIHNLEALNKERVMNISLAQILRDYFPFLPGKPASIGEVWTDKRLIDIPFQEINFEFVTETNYTLQNVIPSAKGDVAVIAMDYEVSLSGSKNWGEYTGIIEGKGAGGGLLNYLIQRGCFQEFKADYQTEAFFVVKKEGKPVMEWPLRFSIFTSALIMN